MKSPKNNTKNMPKAPQRDFSIDHITNRVISEIIVLSDYRKVGIDFRRVCVEVAKEILNRFEKEV